MAARRPRRAAVGQGCDALDRVGRGQLAGLARHRGGPAGAKRSLQGAGESGHAWWLHRCRRARHGRVQPVSRCPEPQLRAGGRSAPPARAGFHGPGARRAGAGHGGSGALFVHRCQQVGQHARAEHFFRVLLRAGRAAPRRSGRRAFPRHHGSGLEAGSDRAATSIPVGLTRGPEHRGALFGAVRLRAGAGRRHGAECPSAFSHGRPRW